MKILFVVKVNGNGVGGHYRSLRTIFEEVSKHENAEILVFGKTIPSAFSGINVKTISIRKNIFKTLKEYKQLLSDNNYDIIHVFDITSLIFTKLIRKKNVVLNKCGGPNIYKYPVAPFMVVFSKENYDYYNSSDSFKKSTIKLIPNRVKQFSCDTKLIDSLKNELNINTEDFVLLRIVRIDKYYENSIKQSILLTRKLQESNSEKNVKLLIIGGNTDKIFLEELNKFTENDKFIYIVTEDKYIKDAKLIIDIADAVIGSGRGFMEACCRNKLLYAPISNSNLPVLVTENNFNYFFNFNFSERAILPDELIEIEQDINKLRDLIPQYKIFTLNIFNSYFDISKGVNSYLDLYKYILENKKKSVCWDKFSIYYLILILYKLIKNG